MTAPMRVALVRPPMLLTRLAHTTPTCPPLGLAYLAGSLRAKGHEVSVVDAVGEGIFRYTPFGSRFLLHGLERDAIVARIRPDVEAIGVSIMFSHELPEARRLIVALRRAFPRALLIVGGEHVTAVPEETLAATPEIDYAVLGEGEETLVELLAALAAGGPVAAVAGLAWRGPDGIPNRSPVRRRIRRVDEIPEPAWDLTPLAAYLDNEKGFGVNRGRSMPVLATRGCPYQCTFCSSPSMWTTAWVAREPARLLAEMERYLGLYRIDNFDFYDLTAIVKRSWIVEFCRLIIERGHGFTWQLPSGTRSEAIDGEVTELLYRAGCRNLSYAPESGSPAVLARIKKKIRKDRMMSSMRAAVHSGLNVKANILLGFPDEVRREMWQSLAFVIEMAVAGIHDVSICSFSPYPGSELFAELRADGRIGHMSDEYYLGLASYTDVADAVTWSKQVGGREIALYRVFGMMTFYGVSFLVRPWRPLRIAWNVLRSRQESRLEMSLSDMVTRLRAGAKAAG